jgi:pimeloyl-ACP methyl ester carboxylesterase
MGRLKRACTLIVGVVSVMSIATGCNQRAPAEASEPTMAPGMPLPGAFGGQDPGSLISAATMPTLDRRLTGASSVAARITYLSTSGVDGSSQEVSGTVFAPMGSPPEGGWPVIAYGHAAIGIRPECAPSLDPMLLGLSNTVMGLVKAGFVVTVSDYQGLGLDRAHHPFLDATTEGRNLIDSVRAARKLIPNVSDRWLAFGGSQGGQAAWAANELAAQYAPDLHIIGSASYSAPLAIDGLADAAVDGTLTSDQRLALMQILASLAAESPDFRLDAYRSGFATENWDALLKCKGAAVAKRDELAEQLSNDDLKPASPQAADILRSRLQAMSLPRVPATAPILVIYGGQDQLIPPTWTDRALDAACRMGDVIQIELQPDKGHDDVAGDPAFPWINSQFAGDPPRNDCPEFIGPSESSPTVDAVTTEPEAAAAQE